MKTSVETGNTGHALILLEDGDLRAYASGCQGAELSGVTVRTASGPVELLHRSNDFSPSSGWRGRAPLLWPAVGRSYTERYLDLLRRGEASPRGGEYRLSGRTWPISIHGFAMRKEWRFLDAWCDPVGAHASFELADDDETRESYPFGFRLKAAFCVNGSKATAAYTVSADSRNAAPMPFSIGNHITFRLPLFRGEAGRHTVRMPGGVVLKLTPESLLNGEREPLNLTGGLPVCDGRVNDAVIAGFAAGECRAELRSPGGMAVRVEQRVTSGAEFTAPEWFVFVLYGKIEEGFYCVEPWYGVPNSLNTGEGLARLPPGRNLTWEMEVGVAEQKRSEAW